MPTANTNRISIVNYSGDDKSLIRSLDCLTGTCSAPLGESHELKVDLTDILKTTVDYATTNYNDGFTMFVKVAGEDLVFEPSVAYTLKMKFAGDTTYTQYGNVVIPPNMFVTRERVKFANGDILILHQTEATSFTVVNPDTNKDYLSDSSHSSNAAYLVKGIGAATNTTQFLRNDGTWVEPTDAKVSQSQSTTTSWRPLLLGNQTSSSTSFSITAQTNVAYVNTNVICQPGTGYIRAVQFITKGGDVTNFVSGNGTLGIALGTATNAHATNKSYVVKGSGYSGTGEGTQFLREDGKWAVPDSNTTYGTFTTGVNGLVPKSGANTGKFLRGDGTWAEPTNTTYAQLGSATSDHAANSNYVVKGSGYSGTGEGTQFLREDGSWIVPDNTTYAQLSSSAHATNKSYVVKGIGSSTNKTQFLRNDGTWTDTITVGQGITTSNVWKPIVLGIQYSNSTNLHLTAQTNVVYVNSNIICNPNSGKLMATQFAIHGGTADQYLKADGTVGTLPTLTSDAHASNKAYVVNGIGDTVSTDKFLRSDGTWETPTGTTYKTLNNSNHSDAEVYVIPGPGGNVDKYLKGDGTWDMPQGGGSTYAVLSASAHEENIQYVIQGSGGNTDKYLKGDGSWSTPLNTDTKVYQGLSNATNGWRPMLMGYATNSGAASATFANTTNQVYMNPSISCLPGYGHIKATKFITKGGSETQFVMGDGTLGTIPVLASNAHANGTGYLVNGPGDSTGKYLKGDGTWGTPPDTNTTYGTFTTAANGLVPKPTAIQAATNYVLAGNGTWQLMSGGGSALQAIGLFGHDSGLGNERQGISMPTCQNSNNFPSTLTVSYGGKLGVARVLFPQEGEDIYALPVEISQDGVIYVPIPAAWGFDIWRQYSDNFELAY